MRLIGLMCLICILQLAKAQNTYIGIKAGGHASSAFIEHTIFNLNVNTTFLPGINAGVFFRHLPKKKDSFVNSGVQIGVNYIQKGWKQLFLFNLPAYTARMNYLEIPIEGIGYFGGRNKYFLSGGLYMEFLLNEDLDPDLDQDNIIGDDFYTYVRDRDREVGYGARLGGGVFRDTSVGTFQIEAFFSYSFSNFIDAGDLTTETPDLSNHWVVGFTVGYMMSLRKKREGE